MQARPNAKGPREAIAGMDLDSEEAIALICCADTGEPLINLSLQGEIAELRILTRMFSVRKCSTGSISLVRAGSSSRQHGLPASLL